MRSSPGGKPSATLHLPSAYYICFSEEDSAAHATLVYHHKSQEPCLPPVTLADKHFYTNVSAVSLNNCRIFPNHNRPFIKIHLLISLMIHLLPEGTAANTVWRDTKQVYQESSFHLVGLYIVFVLGRFTVYRWKPGPRQPREGFPAFEGCMKL